MAKFISSQEAAALVQNNMTVAVGGFITYGVPEDCLVSLQKRYIETSSPKDLTLLHIAAVGDGAEGGANHFGEPGLCKRMICAHIGLEPRLNALAVSNQIEAFLIPQGVASHLTRAIAGGKPGVLTHVGLKTFCDPRLDGCKANQAARDSGYDIVELVQISGKDYLLYKSMPVDICFVKGVLADENGNISLKGEANITEQLELAAAAHNNGGIVVVEVEKLVQGGTIPANEVAIHRRSFPVPQADKDRHGPSRAARLSAYNPGRAGRRTPARGADRSYSHTGLPQPPCPLGTAPRMNNLWKRQI